MSQPSLLDYHQLRQELIECEESNQKYQQRIKGFEQLEKKYSLYVQASAFSQAEIEKVQELAEMKKTINQEKLKITQLNKRIQVFELQTQRDVTFSDQPLRQANEELFRTVTELRQLLDEERARSNVLAQFSSQSKLSNLEESVFRSEIQELRNEVADFEYLKQKCANIQQEKDLVENRLKQIKKENLELNETILTLKDVSADKSKIEDYLAMAGEKDGEILELKVDSAKNEKLAESKTKEVEDLRFQLENSKQLNEALEQENESLKAKVFELQLFNQELQQTQTSTKRSADLLKSQIETSESEQLSESQIDQDREFEAEIELKELRFMLDKAQFQNKQLAKDNESLSQRNSALEQQMAASHDKISHSMDFAKLEAENQKLEVELINLRQQIQERPPVSFTCKKCQEYVIEIYEIEEELTSLRQFKAETREHDEVASELESALQSSKTRLRRCIEQQDEQEGLLERLRAEIAALKDLPAAAEQCENCEKLLEQMDQMLTDFERDKEQWQETEAALKAEYDQISQENDNLREETRGDDQRAKIELLEMENAVLQEKYQFLQQNGPDEWEERFTALKAEKDELQEQLDELLRIAHDQGK